MPRSDEKFILDATAGFRMMWFDKDQPNTEFLDKRTDKEIYEQYCLSERVHNRPALKVRRHKIPTRQGDFKQLPFLNDSFNLVVFDPPYHIRLSDSSWINMRWGKLQAETWQSEIQKGASEMLRVLKPRGILIFKWNNKQIPAKSVLKLFPIKPLFGQRFHNSTSKGKKTYSTFWFCFMKIEPEKKDEA